jgi:hypothetical protein
MTTTTHTSPRGPLARRRRPGLALAAGLAALAMAAPAAAIRNGDYEPPPPPPPAAKDFTIMGSVGVTGCATTPDRISITATGAAQSATVRASLISGVWRYSITNLARGTYTVRPQLDAGVCPYGTWMPVSRVASSPQVATNPIATGVSFTYAAPTAITRVPAPLVAAWLNGALAGAQLRLDNYGPQHGQSFHEPNASYVRWAGATLPFDIPEIQYDLDACGPCPDFGQARFYVNDVNLQSLGASWSSPAFTIDASFESAGREVKGYRTNDSWFDYLDVVSDNQMPDANIDDARISVRLTPVADAQGRLTYALYGSPSFTGTVQATGICDIFGVDICDFVTNYKDRIDGHIEGSLSGLLGSSTARAAVGDALRPVLAGLGIGVLRGAYVEGDTIVLVS